MGILKTRQLCTIFAYFAYITGFYSHNCYSTFRKYFMVHFFQLSSLLRRSFFLISHSIECFCAFRSLRTCARPHNFLFSFSHFPSSFCFSFSIWNLLEYQFVFFLPLELMHVLLDSCSSTNISYSAFVSLFPFGFLWNTNFVSFPSNICSFS